MILIKKGDTTLKVTVGSYQNFFSKMGYEPVGAISSGEASEGYNYPPEVETPPSEESSQLETDEEADSEPAPDDEEAEVLLSEIPLSEMTSEQLTTYAEELGVDLSEAHTRKEMRKAIRAYLNN